MSNLKRRRESDLDGNERMIKIRRTVEYNALTINKLNSEKTIFKIEPIVFPSYMEDTTLDQQTVDDVINMVKSFDSRGVITTIVLYLIENPVNEFITSYKEARYDLSYLLGQYYNFKEIIPKDMVQCYIETEICLSMDMFAVDKFVREMKYDKCYRVGAVLQTMIENKSPFTRNYMLEKMPIQWNQKLVDSVYQCAVMSGNVEIVMWLVECDKKIKRSAIYHAMIIFDSIDVAEVRHIQVLNYLFKVAEGIPDMTKEKYYFPVLFLTILDNAIDNNCDVDKIKVICEQSPIFIIIMRGSDGMLWKIFSSRDDKMIPETLLYLLELFNPPLRVIRKCLDHLETYTDEKICKWIQNNYRKHVVKNEIPK